LRVPVALVSLVDAERQFFKSCTGILPEPWNSQRQTPLSHSFCQHAVASGRPLVIEDARQHPLVKDNSAVDGLGVIAYAGVPLTLSSGQVLGSFCAIDSRPRQWTPDELEILTTLAAGSGRMPPMTVAAVGYGAGTMELETPNVIRLFVGESSAAAVPAASPGEPETVVQVETTVDDMSPQLYDPLMERLFAAGALDVYLTPVIMKKSRPGVVLVALCPPVLAPALAQILFEESTTLGVRWTAYQRARLPREMVTLPTSLGRVSFKVARLDGRVITVTPEFDEVRRLARDKGLSVREALERARAEGRRLLG